MQTKVWEDFISLNSTEHLHNDAIGPISNHLMHDDNSVSWDRQKIPLTLAVGRDVSPIPTESDRELYYGQNHFNYWASGIRDWLQILEWTTPRGLKLENTLDFGCASGRLLRHQYYQTDIKKVIGCDINRLHVDWVARHLPPEIMVFQNSSIPSLPLPSESVDLVTAFSVFTHIDTFDTTWIMELCRILKPGGIAWLTVHSSRTWREIKPGWPLFYALDSHPDYAEMRKSSDLKSDRVVFRWHTDRSYSANVFYREDYLRASWGRVMKVVDFFPALPHFQDIIVLQKEAAA